MIDDYIVTLLHYIFIYKRGRGGKHGNSSLITSVRPSFDLMKPECGSLEE